MAGVLITDFVKSIFVSFILFQRYGIGTLQMFMTYHNSDDC